MGNNVVINGRTAVHAGSGGVLTTTDVCKTPRRCRPQTYTNVARSADAARTAGSVIINGNPACHKDSIFSVSTGDEPGSCGGTRSGTIKQKAEFLDGSPNAYAEGKKLVRQFEPMVSNNRNTSPGRLMQAGAGKPPEVRPTGAEGLEESPLTHKIVPLLVGDQLPTALAGKLTAIGAETGRRFETKLGTNEAIGPDILGIDRWPLTFPLVEEGKYNLFLSYVDMDGALDGEHASLLKDRDYPDNLDMYHIPLGPLVSMQRDKTPDMYDLELVPTYPLRLLRHDDNLCDKLRDGWLYIFIAGKLWREIQVSEKQNRFTDVNLARYQGKDKRPAKTQAQDDVVLLPRHMVKYSGAGFSDQVPLQVAFSEVQWSWAYIERLGGMHRNDPRYLKGLKCYAERKREKRAGKLDTAFRSQRLQSTMLSNYSSRQKGVDNARKTFLVPLDGAVQAAREQERKASASGGQVAKFLENITPRDIETGLPGLVLYDAVGEARDRAALLHFLLISLQELMREMAGRLTDAEKKKLSATERRDVEKQAVNYRTACVLTQYLYVSLENPIPEGLSEDDREALEESIEDRRSAREDCMDEALFFEFTRKEDREKLTRTVHEAKEDLVAFLDRREGEQTFTMAMQDLFAMDGDDYYLHAMKTMSEITRNLLKDGVLVDVALHLKPFDQLKHINEDKGLKLLLNLVGCGDDPHPLCANMFPEEVPPARDEDSSLYDFRDMAVPAGDGRFSSARLRALLRGVGETTAWSEEQFQVVRRFGEALGGWSETHANISHTLFTAAKTIKDAQMHVQAETGKLVTDYRKARAVQQQYADLIKTTRRWRRVMNSLMRVHYVANIVPFEAVPLPVEHIARGPWPKGFVPLDLEVKKAHAQQRLTELKRAGKVDGVMVDVTDQYGNTLGRRPLAHLLNLDSSLSTLYDMAEEGGQPKPKAGRTFVEVYLAREGGGQLGKRLTTGEVEELLKAHEAKLQQAVNDAANDATALRDEIARNRMVIDSPTPARMRREAIMRAGYNTVVLPVMVAVNGVNLWNILTVGLQRPTWRVGVDLSSALLDFAAVSAESANVIARHVYGPITPAQLKMVRDIGLLRTLFLPGVKLPVRLMVLASVLNTIGGVVTAGISLYDASAAITVGDYDAAAGMAVVATGALLVATAGWLVGGKIAILASLSTTLVGIVGLILIAIGAGIIYLCTDTPLEQWLKHSPWGIDEDDRMGGAGTDSLRYQANTVPVLNWIIPDNEFTAWKKYPELAYQRLMDIINRPVVQFKEREETDETIVLQIFTQGFNLSQGDLDLELYYKTYLGKQYRLDYTVENGQVSVPARRLNLPAFWKNVDAKLLRIPGKEGFVNGLEITMYRKDLYALRGEGDVEITARARSWPLGRNATLTPTIGQPYSLPDPERDDDGNVVDVEDYFVAAETSIELPFMPYREPRR